MRRFMARHISMVLALSSALLAGAPSARAERATDSEPNLLETIHRLRDLTAFRLRADFGSASHASVQRTTGVVLGLITGQPDSAVRAALDDYRGPLERVPVQGELSSPFGSRRDPIRKRRQQRHKGIDLVAKRGTPVLAAGPGVVVKARRNGGYGRVIYIDHGDGLETRYAHLSRILVDKGEFVAGGTLIGKVGSTGRTTGPHLHFEVRKHGRAIAPDQALGIAMSPAGLLERLAGALDRIDGGDQRPPRARKARRARTKDRAKRQRELRSRRPST